MSSPAATRMTAAERREQLLDTTKAIVAARGFHSVSIEAVARAAGITRPIVYGHFHDLPGLLEALIERESERAKAQIAAVLPGPLDSPDPRATLLAALAGYLAAVDADPDTWRLVLMPPEGAPELLRQRIAEGRGEAVAQLAEALSPGIGARGESPDPELTARTISALADEAARLLLTDRARYPVDRILAHADWLLSLFL